MSSKEVSLSDILLNPASKKKGSSRKAIKASEEANEMSTSLFSADISYTKQPLRDGIEEEAELRTGLPKVKKNRAKQLASDDIDDTWSSPGNSWDWDVWAPVIRDSKNDPKKDFKKGSKKDSSKDSSKDYIDRLATRYSNATIMPNGDSPSFESPGGWAGLFLRDHLEHTVIDSGVTPKGNRFETLLSSRPGFGQTIATYYSNKDGSYSHESNKGAEYWSDGQGLSRYTRSDGSGWTKQEFAASDNKTGVSDRTLFEEKSNIKQSSSSAVSNAVAHSDVATQGTEHSISKSATKSASLVSNAVSTTASNGHGEEEFEMVGHDDVPSDSSKMCPTCGVPHGILAHISRIIERYHHEIAASRSARLRG